MIIQTSNVQMSSEHEKKEQSTLSKSIDISTPGFNFFAQLEESQALFERSKAMTFSSMTGLASPVSENADPSSNSILVMTENGLQFRTSEERVQVDQSREATKQRLFESLINAINPKYRQRDAAPPIQIPDQNSSAAADTTKGAALGAGAVPVQLEPIRLEMSFKVTETIEEYECSSFSSCGKVTTADGQEIEFGLNLEMERSYSATREFEMTKTVEFTDPLIINFEGNYADLSDEKFEFDLDADGDQELISYLSSSGGMLAIDKNQDGVINDGTELFGALSGNGFADLAQYDEDGNNYIDEADSVFDDLLIWNKTADQDSLQTLAEAGVGAIYLGSTETPFDLKGEDNQHNGQVRSSGFYLTESGDVGTVQQVDMVV